MSSKSLRMPSGPPDKDGYLVKRSKFLHEWRTRYFKLYGKQLFFMKSKNDPPHGLIDLSYCLTVKSAEEKTGKAHCFEVSTSGESYFLCASNELEKDEWIGVIGRSIVQNSRSFVKRELRHDDYDDDDDSTDDEGYMPYK